MGGAGGSSPEGALYKMSRMTEHASERTREHGFERDSPAGRSNISLSVEEMERFYRTMSRVRGFDEKVTELFEAGEIKGTAHSYVGQEAVAAGVCANLTERDFIASHHRGHGHCIAKGASMDRMMAELMGRVTGYCHGLGGSMHIADLDLHILGANGIVGASMPLSCGAALAAKLRGEDTVVVAGMRPVVEIQIFDFIALTMDMMANQAAKFRFMLGGKNTVPLVVRGPQGGGVRLAAQHSQSLEAWFTHIPGLVVVAPSTPYDAKGLLVSSIRDDNPVVFCEAKLSYMTGKGPVPEELYAIPLGKADVKREGGDVTVIATMAMVPRALAAAETLSREGIGVEVIDPRTLCPLDEDTILSSVRKTSRALIVHEAWTTGGFGAEVSALIADKAFMDLDAPVRRLGAPDVPMPYNDALERATIPSVERITGAIREVAAF